MSENVVKNNELAVTTHTIRDAETDDDSDNPTVGTGKGFEGYIYAILEITIGGTDSPAWDITPLLVTAEGDVYGEGETATISGAKTHIRILKVNENSDVNFRVDGKTGTSPTITIKARGLNY